jgi:hypothetical protein
LDGLYVLSPGTGLSCPRHGRIIVTIRLASASGGQDHTTSPAHRLVRPHDQVTLRDRCAYRIPPRRLVTTAKRPSREAGWRQTIMNSEK